MTSSRPCTDTFAAVPLCFDRLLMSASCSVASRVGLDVLRKSFSVPRQTMATAWQAAVLRTSQLASARVA